MLGGRGARTLHALYRTVPVQTSALPTRLSVALVQRQLVLHCRTMSASAPQPSPEEVKGGTQAARGVTPNEMATARFLFDLNGFVVVKQALSPQHVDALNGAIDRHAAEFKSRTPDRPELRNTTAGTPLAGDGVSPRRDLGGMLGWPQEDAAPFRELLAHPVLSRYLTMLCGEGHRLDHSPLVLSQHKGSEGFHLHGGPLTRDGRLNPSLQYQCRPPDVWTSLVAMSVTLTPQPEGAGGFVVVRGSHKMNFPAPAGLIHGLAHTEHLHQPVTAPGDVILFSEATVHGAAQWTADHERRIALFRFAPPECSYGRVGAGEGGWPASYRDGCTAAQLAVLEPAYNKRLDRPCVQPPPFDKSEGSEATAAEAGASAAAVGSAGEGNGQGDGQGGASAEEAELKVVVHSRSVQKKAFDREVFGTEWF